MKHGKAFSFLSILILAGCSNSGSNSGPLSSVLPDQMTGCYATKQGKPAEIKIEEESGKYYASFRESGGWKKEREPLVAASASEIEQLFKKDADKVDIALIYPKGSFGLFKFKDGAIIKGKAPNSDYMALIFFGAGPVFQGSCP